MATGKSIHKQIWDENAECWDQAMGVNGNSFYRHLIKPCATSLLAIQEDENVLELATGNGIFARHMAACGASVIATDISPRLIEIAKARTSDEELKKVFFVPLDVTDAEELEGLITMAQRHNGFDAIVCNMALMDIEDLRPLAVALPRLMKHGVGRFVATVQHPAFNSSRTSRLVEVGEDRVTRRFSTFYSVNIQGYLDIPPTQGEAIPGQPEVQWYFHRPLNELLSVFFNHGLVMDGIGEPAFKEKPNRGVNKELSWLNYTQIPPVFGFRLRRGDCPPLPMLPSYGSSGSTSRSASS